MADQRIENVLCQLLDELEARGIEPTPIRVLAAASDMGLSQDETFELALLIEQREAADGR